MLAMVNGYALAWENVTPGLFATNEFSTARKIISTKDVAK